MSELPDLKKAMTEALPVYEAPASLRTWALEQARAVDQESVRDVRAMYVPRIRTRAWILTIVRNTAYTWLARNRSAVVTTVDDLVAAESANAGQSASFAGDYGSNPEAELIAKADAARIEAAITALPPQFRDTLVLRDIQGLDYREIAAVTEVPVGTVMSRLARARQRLIEAIAADDR